MRTTTQRPPAILAVFSSFLAALLLTGVLVVADASRILAQAVPAVVTGSRVRITAPSVGLSGAVGTVQETTDGELVVRFQNPRGVGRVDRSAIARLEVSIRRERRVLPTLGKGLLIGAGSGAVLGLASGDDPPGFLSFSAEEKAVMLGVAMGLTGGVIGLIAGVAIRHDLWSEVDQQGIDVTILPLLGEGGAGLHFGFTFPVG